MLDNESDWVELYSKALAESHVRVIGIIDVEFKVEFVVSANVNISMGMTYWYKNGKRYVYSILVFSKNVTSDTIDLSEEQYEFSVYAIGTVGIRAGIRLSAGVGLISTGLQVSDFRQRLVDMPRYGGICIISLSMLHLLEEVQALWELYTWK